MELLSKIFITFVPLFHEEQQHRGELFGFEPSENLENSMCTGKRSESCSPAVAYIQPSSFGEAAHIYTCRCEPFFHSDVHRYSRTFRQRMS